MHVWLNGSFVAAEKAHISAFDHGFLYGDGVYETLRTVNGEVFGLQEHWNRLENSAKLLQIPVPFPAASIFANTIALVKKNKLLPPYNARIRWTLTRGVNSYDFCGGKNPSFLITAALLSPYPAEYSTVGMSVTTIAVTRVLPTAKTIALLPLILGKQRLAATGDFECLFLENGYIMEGTVSNFFLQVENEIWMAPRTMVLPGTGASIFVKKMRALGFLFREKKFRPAEVWHFGQAAYLSNALFGVLPVVKLDGKKVGTGKVQPLFHRLQENFWIENN